jgi:hypothetical protein
MPSGVENSLRDTRHYYPQVQLSKDEIADEIETYYTQYQHSFKNGFLSQTYPVAID